jgi:hypothetical protein
VSYQVFNYFGMHSLFDAVAIDPRVFKMKNERKRVSDVMVLTLCSRRVVGALES